MKYYSIIAYNGANKANIRPCFYQTTLVHAPTFGNDIYAYNCVLEEDENASGTLTFSITRENPSLPYIKAGCIVEVRESDSEPQADTLWEYLDNCGKTVWIGRIINLTIDIYGNKSCTCEGMLGFLKDLFIIKYGAHLNNTTLSAALSLLISIVSYNNATEGVSEGYNISYEYSYPECLRIKEVVCDSNISIMNYNISNLSDYFEYDAGMYCYKGNSMPIFDFLNDVFDNFGQPEAEGYPFDDQYIYIHMEIIHPEEEINHIQFIQEPRMAGFRLVIGLDSPHRYGYPSGQNRLIFGESISAASITYDFTKTFTTIRFIGGETNSYGMKNVLGPISDTWVVPQKNVVNGVLDSTNGAIQEWGIIPGIIEKTDMTTQGDINVYANMYRNIAANPVSSFVATGIDLSYEYSYLSEIVLGRYYEVRFPGQDFDNNVIGETTYLYRCIGRKINILNPGQNEYKFSRIIGVMQNGISTMNAKAQVKTQKQIQANNQAEVLELRSQVESLAKELESSKKQILSMTKLLKTNGTALLEGADITTKEEIQNV